jgi:DTW domain-containing protein YfiP
VDEAARGAIVIRAQRCDGCGFELEDCLCDDFPEAMRDLGNCTCCHPVL